MPMSHPSNHARTLSKTGLVHPSGGTGQGLASISVHLSNENATALLGQQLASGLRFGDTVLLRGPLGAGKSHFARAIIRKILGDPDADVPSPSYTLINIFTQETPSAGEIWHVDLYRLASSEEAFELGLDDALGRALTLVEWPERLPDLPIANPIDILLSPTPGGGRTAEIRVSNDRKDILALLEQTHR